MGTIPKGFNLEPEYDRRNITRRGYKNVTVADLRDFIADLPDDSTVWVSRWDEAEDEFYYRPVEGMGAASGGGPHYLTL